MLGTPERVNPTRTTARRVSKICRILGTAAEYYFWLVERIASGSTTRFKIATAAQELQMAWRTIARHNALLIKLGFISIRERMYNNQKTYSEYTLHPINELIGDNGYTMTKLSLCHHDKAVITKRAKKKLTSSPSSRPVSRSQNEVAEAGRADFVSAPASSISIKVQACDGQGFDIDIPDNQPTLIQQILSWSAEHVDELIGCGFKHRDHTSLASDIEKQYVRDDPELWDMFLTTAWPRLQIMLPGCTQALNRMNVGPGWMFKSNQQSNQPNFMDLILTTRYRQDQFRLPETIYPIGTICFDATISQNMRIVGYTHRAYQVCFVSIENPCPSDIHGLGVWDAKEKATPLLGSASSPEAVIVPSPCPPEPQDASGPSTTPSGSAEAPDGPTDEDEKLARQIREMCFAD